MRDRDRAIERKGERGKRGKVVGIRYKESDIES